MANVSKNLNGVVTTGAGSAAPFGGTPGNLSTATAFAATVYVEYVTYP